MMEYANKITNDGGAHGKLVLSVRAALPERMKSEDPALLAPLSLAYIGDTVYDLYVRTLLIDTTTLTVNGLHQRAAKLVCAKAQAAAFRRIEALLDEKELSVYRRGRNSHIGTIPKSASIMDYRTATGLETLIGYLYLAGEEQRLTFLMKRILTEETDGAAQSGN